MSHNPYSYKTAMKAILQDSPVVAVMKTLPRGNGDWPGYSYVYSQISKACDYMMNSAHIGLTDEHVRTMAILGCGHEETMKAELWRLRGRGFLKE